MRLKHYLCAALSCAASLLLCLPLLSCAGGAGAPADIAGFNLPWPPPAGAAPKAVSDVLDVLGKDYSSADGNYGTLGDTLHLSGTPHWSYAIFSIAGLSAANECRSLSIDTSGDHMTPASGTSMYIGLAHYGSSRWLWYSNIDPNWSMSFSLPAEFRSPGGLLSVAIVVVGSGESTVESLHFTIDNSDIGVPQNLTAIADVELITLDWDDVPDAVGYNVYRDVDPAFAAAVKINDAPVPDSTYLDDTVWRGVMFYYRVKAVLFSESGFSNMVDIWSPEIDMPAPQNPHFISNTESSFTVGWEWAGENPSGGFLLYISQTPNFMIDLETEYKSVPSFTRSSTFQDLEQGIIYYWRMCARTSGGSRGRMTDDQSAECGNSWTWSPVEDVGAGMNPFAATVAGTDLAVAYFNTNGTDIVVSLRDGGTWTAEDSGLNTSYKEGGFTQYVGLAYGGGKLLTCTYYSYPGDMYGSVRTDGVWTPEAIDADGSGSVGHPMQGISCVAAASDTEFAVLYLNVTGAGAASEYVASRTIEGGSWNLTKVLDLGTTSAYHSLRFDSDDLYVLMLELMSQNLYFGSRSGGYALTDINAVDTNRGMYNDLERVLGNWMTTAYDPADKSLYEFAGDGTTWETTLIAPGTSTYLAGQLSRLAPYSGGAYAVYYAQNPNGWRFAIFDGLTWKAYRIFVTGVTFDGSLDVQTLDDDPYIIFRDNITDTIKCAKGTPPTP